jgi:hypothetical protein
VRLKCEVVKEICCECTEEEAWSAPWAHVIGSEVELEMPDWDVISVKPNE